jgi:hypothetical protein
MELLSLHTGSYHILLTYKGKILLLQQENVLPTDFDNKWHFIKKAKVKDASAEKTIIQEVYKETHIQLDTVTLIAKKVHETKIHYLFHAQLSDQHVNSIIRGERRLLQFFRLQELLKLQTQPSTKLFLLDDTTLFNDLLAS